MPGEPKNQRPFTRAVKSMAAKVAKVLPKKRKPTQPPAPPPVAKPAPRPKPKPKPTLTPVRKQMREIALLLIANEPKVHYAPVRPMKTRTIKTLAGLKTKLASAAGIAMDCSESVTLIARLAGAPDPNGKNYDQGVTSNSYTGTMLEHCRKITKRQALPGDLVVFGGGDGHHVCMVLSAGDDPRLFSHGQERGPLAIRFSEEAKYQPRPAQFLRFVP